MTLYTKHKSHCPPGNHHASNFWRCPISFHNHPANHQYWWPDTLIIAWAPTRVIIKVKGHHHEWLAGWLWPRNRKLLEVASTVVVWWVVAFLPSDMTQLELPTCATFAHVFYMLDCHTLCSSRQMWLCMCLKWRISPVGGAISYSVPKYYESMACQYNKWTWTWIYSLCTITFYLLYVFLIPLYFVLWGSTSAILASDITPSRFSLQGMLKFSQRETFRMELLFNDMV